MTDGDYPLTGYGVELRINKGWVLLNSIHNTHAAATEAKQSITDQYAPHPADLRVVALTITRKEDTE